MWRLNPKTFPPWSPAPRLLRGEKVRTFIISQLQHHACPPGVCCELPRRPIVIRTRYLLLFGAGHPSLPRPPPALAYYLSRTWEVYISANNHLLPALERPPIRLPCQIQTGTQDISRPHPDLLLHSLRMLLEGSGQAILNSIPHSNFFRAITHTCRFHVHRFGTRSVTRELKDTKAMHGARA